MAKGYEEGDRVVWVGDPASMPVGSSGKVTYLTDDEMVDVNWGGGTEGIHPRRCLATPDEAAKRGIEPWASAFAD